jgi:hypothetical protein
MNAQQIRIEFALADERGEAREPYVTNRMLTEIAAQLAELNATIKGLCSYGDHPALAIHTRGGKPVEVA